MERKGGRRERQRQRHRDRERERDDVFETPFGAVYGGDASRTMGYSQQ